MRGSPQPVNWGPPVLSLLTLSRSQHERQVVAVKLLASLGDSTLLEHTNLGNTVCDKLGDQSPINRMLYLVIIGLSALLAADVVRQRWVALGANARESLTMAGS